MRRSETIACSPQRCSIDDRRVNRAARFELAFGTNHVGPFLLTELLRDHIVASGPGRIVNVASIGHYRAPGIDWEAVRRPTVTRTAFDEYCVSPSRNTRS